jgi:Rod binding domain-containing protein
VSTLPPIDNSVLPADVRRGTQDDQRRYKTALSFERQLVEQLTEQLASTATSPDGDGESPKSAASTSYQQMMPGILADSVMQSGGLGLARTIATSMKESGQ